ncbi:hypothetical protein LTR70_002793 [Exophiala xenobiotica]|uniref:SWR1-complex protein 3 domain-containing protein n=1 Tax=Lithohypha guttulata TaxID=1690604 RepID=A0ABR0KJ80_9EURO|nr:hypothetical protein LTR24_002007 [Lithohypha guttulata]KAK5324509.1 hypothetical protein LTR70_002793 [Exophiala xenobiotica]
MPDEAPARRVLPARSRRESRRASSPPTKPASPTAKATDDSKLKKPYEKRIKTVHVSTSGRSASTPTSIGEEILPTKVTSTRPLPATIEKQTDGLANKQFQSLADSAILAASLHRSRMQWLADGIFKKFWTKPVKRKKVVEEPPNNPDVKSMQKLGNATITIEPHTFEAMFYVVRDPHIVPLPMYKPSIQQTPPVSVQANVHAPTISSIPTKATPAAAKPSPVPATPPPSSHRPPTPPGGAKTTDPVIQMLASRAATDVHLKDLMKVVATSKATPDQLREFQAHIDEFNAIVKQQEAEKEAKAKLAVPTPYRNSPLNPTPQFAAYPTQPRQEAPIKHVVIEFTSPSAAGQAASSDRWLFPEHAVLDTQYGGIEMTCSFFIERKGSDVLVSMKDLPSEEMQTMSNKWKADTEYYQPVTMTIKATQHRTIEAIARSAKSLPEVQKYMEGVMEKKTRAPQDFLVHRLPREKVDSSVDFVDSAVELSGEDDELKDYYPI